MSCNQLLDTPEILKARVQAMEGPALIEAIEKFGREVVGPGAVARGAEMITYRSAGVDIDAGKELVETIKPMCKRTKRAGNAYCQYFVVSAYMLATSH